MMRYKSVDSVIRLKTLYITPWSACTHSIHQEYCLMFFVSVGASIMLLCNLNPSQLHNGNAMKILYKHIIEARPEKLSSSLAFLLYHYTITFNSNNCDCEFKVYVKACYIMNRAKFESGWLGSEE